jgi:hypothetical protein
MAANNSIIKNSITGETYNNLFSGLSFNGGSVLDVYQRQTATLNFTGARTFSTTANFTQIGNIVFLQFNIPSGITTSSANLVGTFTGFSPLPPPIGFLANGFCTLSENSNAYPYQVQYSNAFQVIVQKILPNTNLLGSLPNATTVSGSITLSYLIGT